MVKMTRIHVLSLADLSKNMFPYLPHHTTKEMGGGDPSETSVVKGMRVMLAYNNCMQ